jgi:thiamine-phosphate pyrophosphorylase
LQDFQLYLILDKKLCGNRDPISIAEEAIDGGVDIIQLRDKESPLRKVVETASKLRELTQRRNVIFIVNDRVDVALAVDADGVHLGEDDLPLNLARQILKKDKIIGISTHNLTQAKAAEKKGADYISIGAIFPTLTKVGAPVVSVELVKEFAANIQIPFVAVGAINLNNMEEVVKAGAKRVAVAGAILKRKDVREAAREFKIKLEKVV